MKIKFYLKIVILIVIGASYGCRNTAQEKDLVAQGDMVYMCPMDCEKGKYYDKEGKCPVCGMKLKIKAKPKGEVARYKMTFKATPESFAVGSSASFSFKPVIIGKEAEDVPLDVQHEKKIHLIVVNKDLSIFEHLHPEFQADGSYLINVIGKSQAYKVGPGHQELKFNQAGDYTLFADYIPSGGSHQVEKININVAGSPAKEIPLNANRWEGQSGDYKVKLTSESTAIKQGQAIKFLGAVTDTKGQPVDPASIENYLGAKAHAVVVSVADKEYVHVHPEVVDGKFELNTTFAKAGMYKGWIQFQISGKVHTVDFIFKVD